LLLDNNESDIENELVTRRSLKAKSEKHTGDAKKSAELERRRQKLKEKLSNEDGQHVVDVAKKAQHESSSRMAQHHLPIGLPKSVSLRDDPLTRAQAFLTEMPTIE